MRVADTVDVVAHLEFLVTRAVKDIREATAREEVPDFANGWFSRRTADTSDKGTCEIMRSGERQLLSPVCRLQGVLKATCTGCGEIEGEFFAFPGTDAVIAARNKDGNPTRTENFELFAHRVCIFFRNTRLLITFRHQTDRLRDIMPADSVLEELEDRVVALASLPLFCVFLCTGAPVKVDRDRGRHVLICHNA